MGISLGDDKVLPNIVLEEIDDTGVIKDTVEENDELIDVEVETAECFVRDFVRIRDEERDNEEDFI